MQLNSQVAKSHAACSFRESSKSLGALSPALMTTGTATYS